MKDAEEAARRLVDHLVTIGATKQEIPITVEGQQFVVTVAKRIASPGFVEYRSMLFRRRGDGTLEEDVYCPDCKIAMTDMGQMAWPFYCSRCKRESPFPQSDLNKVLGEVRKLA